MARRITNGNVLDLVLHLLTTRRPAAADVAAAVAEATAPAPKRRGNPEALVKARAAKAAKVADKAARAKVVEAQGFVPVGREVEIGGVTLVAMAPTKRRERQYAGLFKGRAYVGCLRIDDRKQAREVAKAIDAESMVAAMDLLLG